LKRAFTLIELLVVIAIIAILAAILFPVFAQAKAAAKKTASLSNNKQTALAAIMYGSDSDDYIPNMTSWGPPNINDGSYVYFATTTGTRGCHPWPQLIQPYVKNLDLLLDPQAPGISTTPTGFNPAAYKLFQPEYGMNPYLAQTGLAIPYAAGSTATPRSFTGVSRVADTVMFSQKYSNAETVTNVFYGGWWFQDLWFITLETDPPDCESPGNTYICAAGWGDNGFYGGTAGQKELKNVEAAGAWTGGASLRSTKNMLVSYVDGHAASKAPGALAEGTNYQNAQATTGIPNQHSNQIVVTDITRDHWYGIQ
jgi:prepilin-type N-terminal cleavage/methylation domain-containing protein